MDTSEKPETPQPTTKDNPQKEQNDNSVAGMLTQMIFFYYYLT